MAVREMMEALLLGSVWVLLLLLSCFSACDDNLPFANFCSARQTHSTFFIFCKWSNNQTGLPIPLHMSPFPLAASASASQSSIFLLALFLFFVSSPPHSSHSSSPPSRSCTSVSTAHLPIEEALQPCLQPTTDLAAIMAFSGTQLKCKACEKTVYLVDQLTADEIVYHKSCFRCHHCNRTLQLSDYSSFDGVPYCKPHFEQLFKLTGSFEKSFEAAKPFHKFETDTRSPSKASSFFSGTQDKCISCEKTVYPLEKVSVEGLSYHKLCFKCSHGGCFISPSNYAALEGRLYCKHHYSQLFKEKGNYSQLVKIPPVKPTGHTAEF